MNMLIDPIFIFSFSIIFTWICFHLGKQFALDHPNDRKKHFLSTPQIGGLIIGPATLILCYLNNLIPVWYLWGGIVTILLGIIDDVYHIPWYIKLTVQLIILCFISNIFWHKVDNIVFFNFVFSLSPTVQFIVFSIWFIGIFNAINLLDGLDGLAGGLMFVISIFISIANVEVISEISFILSIVLLGFLVFNQRPAKLFMGDSGSLFLGYHMSVLPLLFIGSGKNIINMTPFILLASYPIADTTRVFFTRLASKKSPMTADTIHFHHLMIKQSSSYLSSIGSIYLITSLTSILALYSFNNFLNTDEILIIYLALLLFFILSPPLQTYVPLINNLLYYM